MCVCVYVYIYVCILYTPGFPHGSVVKNLPANAGDRFSPWVGKIPWRRKWQPTPVLLPEKSHRQRRLVATGHGSAKKRTRLSMPSCTGVLHTDTQ